ncbi:MAG: DUF438 domain-containing protein [Bacteroidales bacterium]|nr:DUF438 domain-containing protein [Bacteroidales bacterium]
MSELINNSSERKKRLKELILKLHSGESQEEVREQLIETLGMVPYGDVVEVEQELINEGLPVEEVLKLCDIHAEVLHGNIDLSGSAQIPEGHPIDVMIQENKALYKEGGDLETLLTNLNVVGETELPNLILKLRQGFNNLYDVDKHYLRKEYLLFPYLEQYEITGVPKVMWGKQDEIREQLKASIEALQTPDINLSDLEALAEILLLPAVIGVLDMIKKEEEILFPMSLDKLKEEDWYEIHKQSLEIGFCLYDPPVDWRPDWVTEDALHEMNKSAEHVQLPSGSFTIEELMTLLNTLPIDMTFVDKDDKVKYFSQSAERFFQRNRAILNRDVRLCHPPGSSNIVEKIIDDFKTGKASRAPFWIQMGDKLVHIEYFALRNEKGEYLGTLEVSHDVSYYRNLEGERRILSYSK